MRTQFRAALAGAAVLTMTFTPVIADATPGRGVTGTIIAKTTVGDTDYTLRRIVIDPGGSTGWHYHDGMLYAAVEGGTLTHSDSTCKPDGIYSKGAVFTEPSDQVHIGRNLGTKPLVLNVLYVLPKGSPLAQDAPNPGCDFQ
ncbi:cupin domain-containing protein [Kribbella sp. NBC_01245]|uniref:cupin domain-containing protein n=1 Tax=Kribbella sp. NBC_01245 TaxID=2903578 RepID=UPI002E2BDE7F|nr:cupin domain-containing protein [Kribbella sp. NBC_01245]